MSDGVESFASLPIVGPGDSVIRFLRGEPVTTEDIEADQSRSDVWTATREQYVRWLLIYPDKDAHPPLEPT